jgi:ribonuclease HI
MELSWPLAPLMRLKILLTMIDFQILLAIAYKKEAALGRRLAKSSGASPHEALMQVLQQVAGDRPLGELVAAREAAARVAANRAESRLAARRQARADALTNRREKNGPDPGAWLGWFDGSTHPNPGKMGLGGLLLSPAGERVEICAAAGHGDNNQAEYLALIALLEAAVRAQPAKLIVYGDSQVVIEGVTQQVRGGGAAGLSHYCERARQLISQLRSVELRWIPRRRNAAADALSQHAVRLIGAQMSTPASTLVLA